MKSLRLLYIASRATEFRRAEERFRASIKQPLESDVSSEVLRYFHVRRKWEKHEYIVPVAADFEFLNEARRRFHGERFEGLYQAWVAGRIAETELRPAFSRLAPPHLGDRKTGRVFESRSGRPLLSQDINRKFLKALCEPLGIPVGTMHAFRHGRASQMQAAGLPGDFVTSQIGHSSLKITSIYTHFEHEKKRSLAEQLLFCTQTGNLYSVANEAKSS